MTDLDDELERLSEGLPKPPKEILRDVAPPLGLQLKLRDPERSTLCGGRFVVQFTSGRLVGREIPMYCAEPLCIEQRVCTGPRFIPTIEQANRPKRQRPSMEAVVAAARECAKKATGKDDPRTDQEIVRYVRRVTQRALKAFRGGGHWTPT